MYFNQQSARYVQFPWVFQVQHPYPVDPQHAQWVQSQYGNPQLVNGRNNENEENTEHVNNVEGERPPAYTGAPMMHPSSTMQHMYQMVPPMSNLYVGSVPSNVNVHGYVNTPLSYPPMYGATGNESTTLTNDNQTPTDGSMKEDKPSEKASDGNFTVESPENSNNVSAVSGVPYHQQHPNFVPIAPMHPYGFPYYAQPPGHMPSAQQATGSPLYISHPSGIPLYHPGGPIFAPGPIYPCDNGIQMTNANSSIGNAEYPQEVTITEYHVESNGSTDDNQQSTDTTIPIIEQPTEVSIKEQEKVVCEAEVDKPLLSDKVRQDEPSENESVKAVVTNNNSFTEQETIIKNGEKVTRSVESQNANNEEPPILPQTTTQVSPNKSDQIVSDVASTSSVVSSLSNNTRSVNASVENLSDKLQATEIKQESYSPGETKEKGNQIAKDELSNGNNEKGDLWSKKDFPIPGGNTKSSIHQDEENNDATPSGKSWASLFKSDGTKKSSYRKPRVVPFQGETNTTYASPGPANGNGYSSSGSTAGYNPSPRLNYKNKYSKSYSSSTSIHEDYNLRRVGEFLKHYRLDHKGVHFEPRGINNRGNYCYVNAIIQALLACPPFYNLLKSVSHNLHRGDGKTPKSDYPIIDSMIQLVEEFTLISQRQRKDKSRKTDEYVTRTNVQSGNPFEPVYIYKVLPIIRDSSNFVKGQQEDAQEFLTCLLNGINDELIQLIQMVNERPSNGHNSGNKKGNKGITNGYQELNGTNETDSEWKEVSLKNKATVTHRQNIQQTPLTCIFQGLTRSRLQKMGDQSVNNIEPFFTLHLNIEKVSSVKDALELMVGRDMLEGVTSSKTNQEVDAWQQQSLEELPYVLLLHLKCFDYKQQTCTKILKNIDFSVDLKLEQKLLSATLRSKSTQTNRLYKLFAVIYHDGKEANKGHYITDVFHVGYGGWIRYDDARVTNVDEREVLKPKLPRMPYILFYRRWDTIAALMPR